MRRKPRNKRAIFRPLFSVLAVILGLVLVGPISPADAGGDPPGNNGTVKVDDDPFGGPNGHGNGGTGNGVGNDPHLGCVFQVEWYGFDQGAGIVSQVSFAMQAPTAGVGLSVSGPSSVFVGGDAAGGGKDLDGKQTYTLSFDGPGQKNHGYHVKLTVNTPGSQGADKKSKVYWVEGCQDASAAVSTSPATCTMGEQLVLGDIANADWGEITHPDGPDSYSVTATAWAGHLFADGSATKTFTGTLAGPDESKCGVAAADVSISPATCDSGETLNLGATDNATWGEPTYTDNGDGTTHYVVVATATEGNLFPADGDGVSEDQTTKTFEGDLAGPNECLPDQAVAGVHTNPATCDAPEQLVLDTPTNATWGEPDYTDNGDGTTHYAVTATAVDGATFDGGGTTQDFSGDLAGKKTTGSCVEVEGEQGHSGHGGKKHPEVKGEQAHAPQVVPSQVEAGLAGTPAGTPNGGGSSLPLWALSVGAGLFLTGASRLRRTGRIPR